jgi:hypothetical protein
VSGATWRAGPMFKDLDDNRQIIYVLGLFIAFMALGTGLVLTDKKKGN